MKTYRSILCIAAGLLFFVAACRQDADPTPTSNPQAPTSTVASSAPVVEPITATSSAQPADEAKKGPIYEWLVTWGDDPSSGISFSSPNGIAIDSSDNVYVTEFRGNRV